MDKWPQVRTEKNGTVNLRQPRLVLLLCAALGYETVDKLKENKDKINRLLKAAWDFLSTNILSGNDDKGYTLNLLGNEVKICISTKSYLCPVDKVLLDTVFCGYSPHLSGRLTQENIERFRIATQEVEKRARRRLNFAPSRHLSAIRWQRVKTTSPSADGSKRILSNTRRPDSIMTGWSAHS